MHTGIYISGSRFEVLCGDEGVGPRRDLDNAAVSVLAGFAQRYATLRLMEAGQAAMGLLALGRELYAWLEGDAGQLTQLRERAPRPFMFEIRGPRTPAEAQWALLRAPWELLADNRGFLAQDALLNFCPVRRLGRAEAAEPLDDYRLGLAFMASAPRGQRELDYEAEESAILRAVGEGDIDLLVEESGDPEELGRRLKDLVAMSALHLSCHGMSAWRPKEAPDAPPRPVLMMEDAEGNERPTDAGTLVQELPAPLRLVFLSACLSAAAGEGAKGLLVGPDEKRAEAGRMAGEVAHSLATALVEGGFPAVLGWDGSVADVAATTFAGELYDRLAKSVDVARAVADARRVLLNATNENVRRDWHLARLWLGPQGGGPVVGGKRKRSMLPTTHGYKAFLAEDRRKVRVASHEMFVGRRRQLQRALRALGDRHHAGVLVHGIGRIGKSSLAARIANRRRDMALAVVFEHYDALSVVEALEGALRAYPSARDLLKKQKPHVRDDPAQLEELLIDLLAGPCAQANAQGSSVLLVIDDLERILVAADSKGRPHRPDPAYASVLSMILRAFDPARTDSRVLFTSRFPFTLDGLEEVLETIPLPPLSDNEQRKLELRQRASARDKRLSETEQRVALLSQARAIALGNPGLQDLIGQGQVMSKDVPLAQVQEVLKETEAWLAGGDLPKETRVRDFLKDLKIDVLLKLAEAGGRNLLKATSLFELPVPEHVLEGLVTQVGGSVLRLRDLGLLDVFEDVVDPRVDALAANQLALSRLKPLSMEECKTVAKLAVPTLFAAWGGVQGREWRPLAADLELTRIGMLAEDGEVVAACAADAMQALQGAPAEVAAAVGGTAIALLDWLGLEVPWLLLSHTAAAEATAGEGGQADTLLERGVEAIEAKRAAGEVVDPLASESLLYEQANRKMTRGELGAAQRLYEELAIFAKQRGSDRDATVARGKVADILQARGQLDEALRIRREEQLPVYERLGAVQEKAGTISKIADILRTRGQLDKALRLLHEEVLPVYERLGNMRGKAVTVGKIADILQDLGLLDEALRLYRKELPVYERLGAIRDKAVTIGKIAGILRVRGQLDEALRLHREEQLPVYERLGDIRGKAVTVGKIADILQARGLLDEALRLHCEEELPVYEQLDAVRDKAVTMGRIADILQARGQLDEALRLRCEEQLPVYKRLGDMRSTASTIIAIANILQARGQLERARVFQEERLEINRKLGNASSIAASLWDIAQIELTQNTREKVMDAVPRIAEAYSIVESIDQAEGIAVIGSVFGQLLTVHERERGIAVLRRSADAFRRLGRVQEAEEVERLIQNGENKQPLGGSV